MEKPTRAATGRDSDKYIVRFPNGMREQIAAAAKANNRSMNAEIISRLGDSFSPVQGDATVEADLKYRLLFLESEVLARQADLVDVTALIEEYASTLPAGVLDANSNPSRVIARLRKMLRRYFLSPDAEVKLNKDRQEKMTALVHEIQSRQSNSTSEVVAADIKPKRAKAPK